MILKRRQFLFRSLQAALLLSPVLSIRRAEAQNVTPRKRLFIVVYSAGYPDEAAWFPTGDGASFQLSPMLQGLAGVKDNMVVIDNVDIRDSGLNPAGANHARAPGKVLTAKDMRDNPNDTEGWPGDISIDQYVARERGLNTLELMMSTDAPRSIREQPFALGPDVIKPPILQPTEAWDKVFGNFTPPADTGPAREAKLRRLRARKSLLDGVGEDLRRLRAELSGIEKLKLDIHEDAIRKTELNVAKDLAELPPPSTKCEPPVRAGGPGIPFAAKSHLDLMFAAFACDRVQVGGVVWGGSGVGGYDWHYDWVPGLHITDLHNDVHHMAETQRDTYLRAAAWDWEQLGGFVQRLRDTPEGDGNMLDHSVVLGISHFSHHHDIRRLPVLLFGTQKSGFTPGRYLKQASPIHNDRVLTSVANLMGVACNGFGDDLNCGPVPGLI